MQVVGQIHSRNIESLCVDEKDTFDFFEIWILVVWNEQMGIM